MTEIQALIRLFIFTTLFYVSKIYCEEFNTEIFQFCQDNGHKYVTFVNFGALHLNSTKSAYQYGIRARFLSQ